MTNWPIRQCQNGKERTTKIIVLFINWTLPTSTITPNTEKAEEKYTNKWPLYQFPNETGKWHSLLFFFGILQVLKNRPNLKCRFFRFPEQIIMFLLDSFSLSLSFFPQWNVIYVVVH